MTNNNNSDLKEYRSQLLILLNKSQEKYDRYVITLAGGSLGISIAFLRDIVGQNPITNKEFVTLSWSCWGLSIVCTLISFFTSCSAMRKTIKQVDADKIYDEYIGGVFAIITKALNICGGLFFIMGVFFFVYFVTKNMG